MNTPIPPPTGGAAEPRRTRLIPEDQNTLSEMLTRVAAASAGSAYELSWKSYAEATQLAVDLAASLATRDDLGDDRQIKSARIRTLQAELDRGATRVKSYLNDEWEDDAEAESYYATFGFVEENEDDVLPSAQEARATAIKTKLLPALVTYGMGSRKFGTAWWTPRLAEYQTLTGANQQAAQDIAGAVGAKNPLEDEARLYLSKFDSRLYAECRTQDEYLALRRKMGYLKEYN